jgi:1-acyl-sn-glycerol-3-phosphate acyltransferase
METASQGDPDRLERALEAIGRVVDRGGAALRRFHDEVLTELDRRLDAISATVGEEGIDPFGMDPAALRSSAIGAAFLYKVYFRCLTRGLDRIPAGPVILVANHAGQLPLDGVMITTGMLLEGDPPRLARSLVDRWVPTLPFVSVLFSRVGVAVGTPENAQLLLSRGEALLTFPEGMSGITKTVDQAYQLQRFGLGFMRLALASKAPIVPVAVVGSEEQYPTLYNLKGVGKLVGLPALPIWAQMIVPVLGLLPLPVRYRMEFGEPLRFSGDPDDEDAVIETKVDEVREQLKGMIAELRAERRSIFCAPPAARRSCP